MKRILFSSVFIVAIAALSAAHAETAAYDGAKLAKDPKLTIQQAEAAALTARPGKFTDKELENEHGRLRYSFDIDSGGKAYDVAIDAQTGQVLQNALERGDEKETDKKQ